MPFDTALAHGGPAALLVLVLTLASCAPVGLPALDMESLSLLRLEYLERAERLPSINIDRVFLPELNHLGRLSPMLWRIRSESLPQRELLRPLPIEDVDLRLRETFSKTLQEFGFTMKGWTGQPDLRMRVDVERLVLLSENGSADRRACELHLLLRIEENPSGLEITRYRCRTRSEIPGSWLSLRGEFAQWVPRGGEPDPFEAAVAEAARQFLNQSLEFWKRPANWREGGVQLSDGLGRPGYPTADATNSTTL